MNVRYAPEDLRNRADLVNEVIDRKSPDGCVLKKGIQFQKASYEDLFLPSLDPQAYLF